MSVSKNRRTPISKRRRFDVFKRDGFACTYCGRKPPEVLLQVDHIIPVKDGGGNDEGNLTTACQPCNIGKSAHSLQAIPESLTDRAAKIRESEEQLAAYAATMKAQAQRVEDDIWAIFRELNGEHCQVVSQKQFDGVTRIVERIPPADAMKWARVARGKCIYSDPKRFLYFAKCCWNQIKGVP